jgi:DNA-binding NtrC family response regulator
MKLNEKAVILCVDDEMVILNSLKKQLKKAFGDTYGYEIAESADEAMEIIEEMNEDKKTILLIVSDWLMPGMKGDDFLIHVHQKFPHIVTIMLTGQADEDAIKRATEQANLYCCLHKPLNTEVLIKTIQSSLANHE